MLKLELELPVQTQIVTHLDAILDGLTERKFVCIDNFLPDNHFKNLCREAQREHLEGLTRPAKIGRLAKKRQNKKIRGDKIRWINRDQVPKSITPVLTALDDLRDQLRVNLFLPLHDTEQHFAVYPPGAQYRRHLDCHRDSNNRVITFILYLNRKNWSPSKGGQLKVWFDNKNIEEFCPKGNRLILFSSPDFYHAVLPAVTERYSMTGWFRRKPALL